MKLIPNAWIGSPSAFEKYQSLFHRAPHEPHPLIAPAGPHPLDGRKGMVFSPQIPDVPLDAVYKRMLGAVEIVIDDSSCPEVGGFAVGFVISNRVAKVWPRLSASAIVVPSIKASPSRDFLFGEAQTGDFTYSLMAAMNANENVIGIALAHAQIGIVLRDDPNQSAEILHGVIFDEARATLENHLGTPLWAVNMRNERGQYVIRDQ